MEKVRSGGLLGLFADFGGRSGIWGIVRHEFRWRVIVSLGVVLIPIKIFLVQIRDKFSSQIGGGLQ